MKWNNLGPPILPMDNTVKSFWQSRSNLRESPEMTDLLDLARKVRHCHNTSWIVNWGDGFTSVFTDPQTERDMRDE